MIDNLFDFKGFFAVVRYKGDVKEYLYAFASELLDGAKLQKGYYGTIHGFTRELTNKNLIYLDADADIDISKIIGRMINIHNDGEINAAYNILDAYHDGNVVVACIGDVSLIRGYDKSGAGFEYNISDGAAWEILL